LEFIFRLFFSVQLFGALSVADQSTYQSPINLLSDWNDRADQCIYQLPINVLISYRSISLSDWIDRAWDVANLRVETRRLCQSQSMMGVAVTYACAAGCCFG
jgi:hypothetical protein